MATHVTGDTLLERVKDIAPMLRAYAAEAEAQRRLARPVVDAMLQAGLYSMAHPKAFGGLEVAPLTMFRVVEAVAYQDSAAGWNMQMSVGASCFLAWLPEEGAAEILTSPPTPIVAGTLFPGRQAIPVAGGSRLRGQWPFVTGSHEGHWFMCLPQIMDGDPPRGTAQGRPVAARLTTPLQKMNYPAASCGVSTPCWRIALAPPVWRGRVVLG